jgi:4'-phosphopantetheinyl transferase
VIGEPRGEVHVFFCETHGLSAAHVSAMLSALSPDERDRQERFAFAEDRRDYVAAHVLLRTALATRQETAPDGLRFGATPSGKPFLLPPSDGSPVPAFSITHSRGVVACAVAAGGRIGVDAESVEACARAVDVARRVFSPAEAAALDRLADHERGAHVCALWTLKEAYSKAIGLGLAQSFTHPSFGVSGTQVDSVGAEGWLFALASVGVTHKLAVAVDAPVAIRVGSADALALAAAELRVKEFAGAVIRSRPDDDAAVALA